MLHLQIKVLHISCGFTPLKRTFLERNLGSLLWKLAYRYRIKREIDAYPSNTFYFIAWRRRNC